MDLKGRHFLKLMDYTPEEITYLLDLAADLKDKKKKGIPVNCFQGKNVALIFEKTSTRTRCSFEVAAHDLGLGTTYLDPSGSQIGKKDVYKRQSGDHTAHRGGRRNRRRYHEPGNGGYL